MKTQKKNPFTFEILKAQIKIKGIFRSLSFKNKRKIKIKIKNPKKNSFLHLKHFFQKFPPKRRS